MINTEIIYKIVRNLKLLKNINLLLNLLLNTYLYNIVIFINFVKPSTF